MVASKELSVIMLPTIVSEPPLNSGKILQITPLSHEGLPSSMYLSTAAEFVNPLRLIQCLNESIS